jgi:hypothetical protein
VRAACFAFTLGALALGAGSTGCERMIIGRLPAQIDAAVDVAHDAPVEASTDERDTGAAPSDARTGDTAADRPSDAVADRGAGDSPAPGDGSASGDARDSGGDRAPADTAAADASPVADAASEAGADRGASAIGVLAGRITMSDTIAFTVRGSGVAGVLVTLSGPSARTAVSDANGAFQFPSVAPGTYSVAVSKAGATFTPPSATGVAVSGDSAGTVVSFDCAPPCGTGPTIDPARELFIQDATVLADARASNASDGAWSFRYLIEQMATTSPNNYVNDFINNIVASGRDMSRLRLQWLTVIENSVVLPDITRAPFQLLAIVNGIDAHEAGQGELRFVYGIYDVPGAPTFNPQGRTFTLMLTYALPATAALPNRQAWAARFHALGAIPFGADYNTALQAITDSVVRTATLPSTAENPRGSTLVALSINEEFGNPSPFQLRQLRPLPDPVHGQRELIVGTVDHSPDASLNMMNGALPDFLNANAALVQAGFAVLPPALLGMQSPAATSPILWAFPSVTSEPLRHAFAGQTCAGCHSSEVPAGAGFTIFHVIPYNGPTASSTSGWVTIVDLPRRVSFLQNQLSCSGNTCAPGAEPMMGPVR